ncbi:MAG: DUF4301 family protein [Myxococcota bacterium]
MTWTNEDQRWAEESGIDLSHLDAQLIRIRDGQQPTVVDRPCTVGDGIETCDEATRDAYAARARQAEGRVTHFVPASGAASRMFRAIASAHPTTDPSALPASARQAFEGRDRLAVGIGLGQATLTQAFAAWIDQHRYASMPKGLLPFHRYGEQSRCAAEEHFREAVAVSSQDGRVTVHFTVPEAFEDAFHAIARAHPHIAFTTSVQRRNTDTVATDASGAVWRGEDGRILLRPGGHGALLHNLHALGADLVTIKNIDNVVRDEPRPVVVAWRRALLGRLLELEQAVHEQLRGLRDGTVEPSAALQFAATQFGRAPKEGDPMAAAMDALNRPLRVCGMVRNAGEPGGGPFWAYTSDGSCTKQIVESAQIDRTQAPQAAAVAKATHFNPVDLVASLRDGDGKPFDLARFIDDEQWFVVEKSKHGRSLMALERPGLWNGAMAGWNTVFVEVPAETFHPVKELRDLLRPGHVAVTPTVPA